MQKIIQNTPSDSKIVISIAMLHFKFIAVFSLFCIIFKLDAIIMQISYTFCLPLNGI